MTDPAPHAPGPAAGGPGYWVFVPPAAPPFHQPTGQWAEPKQRTTLGRTALTLAISAIAGPIVWLVIIVVADFPFPFRVYAVFGGVLAGIAAAVVAVVLASRGMARKYSNRGLAIAGLVVGLVA